MSNLKLVFVLVALFGALCFALGKARVHIGSNGVQLSWAPDALDIFY